VTVAASQLLEVAAVGRPHQPLVVLDGGREPLSGHLSPDPVPHLLGGDSLTLYASDGVHDPATVPAAGRGFDVFRVDGPSTGVSVDHLNPQTQESVIGG